MGRHQSDFANNVGPEFDILAFQTCQINAQNSFGNDLSSQIDDQETKNFIPIRVELWPEAWISILA